MWQYNTKFPSIDDLRLKAKRRIPAFAFEYLDGGCNEDINVRKNTDDLRKVEMIPSYLKDFKSPDLRTELFGSMYDAPFGIAPIGLQGLIWPNAPEILAKAAVEHNIPFILSTVTTSSIERIAEVTRGKAWYQLYHPADDRLRDDILRRLESSGYSVLVLLCDVPSFGFRPRDIRNGLAMPPKMTFSNVLQIAGKPSWAINTLWHGIPHFASLKPYMEEGLSLKQLGMFMNKTFDGKLNEERIKYIRDKWKGKIVLKGVAGLADTEMAIKLGVDGIIVSNHGGRQLDMAQSSIQSLLPIVKMYKKKISIMIDSGIRSGPDVIRAIACGADFTFLGRSFMYGVAALGAGGGNHVTGLLKTQLKQVLEQLSCEKVSDSSGCLVS